MWRLVHVQPAHRLLGSLGSGLGVGGGKAQVAGRGEAAVARLASFSEPVVAVDADGDDAQDAVLVERALGGCPGLC